LSDRGRITNKIARIFGEQFGINSKAIDVSASLDDQKIDADELDVVELVMAVEEEFDIDIEDEELDDLTKSLSVNSFADLVASKRKP
jgi:acyl carrier protein